MKKVCIIFLGHFNLDARCINMAQTILDSKIYNLSVINLKCEPTSLEKFKKITFFNIQISNTKIFRFYDFHTKVKQILKKNNFDILIASDLYSLSSAAKHSTKLIYDCREIYSELEAHISRPLYKLFWKQYEQYYLKFVNHIMVTAESDKKILKNLYTLNNIYFHTIYNYPKYIKYKKNHKLREMYKINNKFKIILYQGVVQKGRGITKLMKLIKKHSEFVAVIIGNGQDKKKYIQYANHHNLEDTVIFIDAVPYLNLLEYTASADIGWLVINKNSISNQLALPNKLFEYVLMGLPVLSSDIQNVSLIMKQFNVGKIIKNMDDITECFDGAVSLLNHNISAEELHNIACKNFIWEKQKNKFLSILT